MLDTIPPYDLNSNLSDQLMDELRTDIFYLDSCINVEQVYENWFVKISYINHIYREVFLHWKFEYENV